MGTAHEELDTRVISKLSVYTRPLFSWLWAELKAICPEASYRENLRYVGLYPWEGSRKIFAYIDSQKSGLFIGIFKSVFERLAPQAFEACHFPDWNPSGKLIGLMVVEQNQEIIEILDGARKARVDGLSSVQRLRTRVDEDIDRLLPQTKQDIDSLEYEEGRFEGEKRSRYSNYFERDPKLRAQAIAVHGTTCMVEACGFNFEEVYGPRGQDFIEVHHVQPLCTLDPDALRRTDVRTDMAVVCSNCHRMIHRHRNRILSLKQVSALITKHYWPNKEYKSGHPFCYKIQYA